MPTHTLKQFNTRHAIEADFSDDLTGVVAADVQFVMTDLDGEAVDLEGDLTITNASLGKVKYEWADADVANSGIFRGEFFVTFADGGTETFPNDDYLWIVILPALPTPTP